MRRPVLWLAVVAVAVVAAVAVTGLWGSVVPAQAGASYSAPLRTAVASLTVASEDRAGYARSLFPHWIDVDGDGCNSRNEVLIAEATVAPTVGSGCRLSGGAWYSYYDDASYTATASLDIDHMVALAEAWDSGARTWTTARRQAYANDLDDDRTLVAVKDSVNQSKGDQDPAEWMPPSSKATCRYLNEWVAVKIRWRLTVDTAEKSSLTSYANSCTNVTITVTYAY
jgi:hypothetical protein